MNQFVATAVAEKLSAMRTEAFFEERRRRTDLGELKRLLSRNGGQPPRDGDERDPTPSAS